MARRTTSIIALSMMLTGCATHRLVVPEPNPIDGRQRVSSNAYGWGSVQRRTVARCDSNLIDEVRVRQNIGQALVTVLTLGFWMPTSIEYRCAKTPSPETDIGDRPSEEAQDGGR
jgi:hypothetical protein